MGIPPSTSAEEVCRYVIAELISVLFRLTVFLSWGGKPTLNPDSSLGRDLVLFDRVSTKIRHEYHRDDVVALQYVLIPLHTHAAHPVLHSYPFHQFPDQP